MCVCVCVCVCKDSTSSARPSLCSHRRRPSHRVAGPPGSGSSMFVWVAPLAMLSTALSCGTAAKISGDFA